MSSTTTMTARPRRFTTAVLFAVGFLSALLLSRLLNDVETLESGARDVHEKQAVEKIPFQPKPKHPSNHTSSSDTGNKTTFKSNGDVGSPVKAKLSDYINTNTYEIQADVSNLLDFAIVGNPKTGTTFLIQWLNLHPQLWLHPHEIRVFDEKARGPGLMVEAMFPPYANNSDHKRLGYKVRNFPSHRPSLSERAYSSFVILVPRRHSQCQAYVLFPRLLSSYSCDRRSAPSRVVVSKASSFCLFSTSGRIHHSSSLSKFCISQLLQLSHSRRTADAAAS
jgi:hypothetical protein